MPAHGSAYIELRIECRRALSLLTEGWTEKEVERLYRGDDEAREALLDDLREEALRDADEIDVEHWTLDLSDPKKAA